METVVLGLAWLVLAWATIAVCWDRWEAYETRKGQVRYVTARDRLQQRLAEEPHFLLPYDNEKVCRHCPRHGPGPRQDMIDWCKENLKNGFDRVFFRDIEVGFRQEIDEKLYLFFADADEQFMFKMRWL